MLGDLISWLPLGLPAFLFVITVVVFFHELGHFSVARACGVDVETFSVGFGPAIVSWMDSKGTRWKISWIPLGGYVQFAGDADMSSRPDRKKIEEMSEAEKSKLFLFKPLWRRAAVVAAGPAANFILAFAIFFCLVLANGREEIRPVIGALDPKGAAAAAGLKSGDLVVSLDGKPVTAYGDIDREVVPNPDRTLHLGLLRNGRPLEIVVTPKRRVVPDGMGGTLQIGALGARPRYRAFAGSVVPHSAAEAAGFKAGDEIFSVEGAPIADFNALLDIVMVSQGKTLQVGVLRQGRRLVLTPAIRGQEDTDQSGKPHLRGFLGLSRGVDPEAVTTRHFGPIAAAQDAVHQIWFVVDNTLTNVARIFSGHQDATQLTGPIGIARVSEQVAATGILPLLTLAAFISVSIGLVNLFPVPILDGGHLLYYGFEAVLGRPLGARAQDLGFRVGLAVMLGLMLLATWNDLVRLHLF